MGKHALLSASSSHRWLNCNPSARLELEFDDRTSNAAAEGTAAHALCEHKLLKVLKIHSKKPTSPFDCDEMDEHCNNYVGFVMEQLELAKQHCKDPLVLIEQKLDFSEYVPDGFGTGDCVIIADEIIHIIDFKYGQGVFVHAENNPQMMLYALGALTLFDSLYDISEISMTIYQPRRENVSTWTISTSDLYDWADNTLKPNAELAFNGEGEYCSGEWCGFCKAKNKCRARAEKNLQLAKYEFTLPPLLTNEEIEDILLKLDELTKWANEIFVYATDAATNHGKQWKGFKVVEGRSVRKFSDETAVVKAAENAGYHDIYNKSLLGITAMEKYLGKTKFNELLGSYVIKPSGKPALVPASDKRPAITKSDAINDFNEYMEENPLLATAGSHFSSEN